MNSLTPYLAEKQGSADLESLIRRIGHDLAARSQDSTPAVFNQRWWSTTLMNWSMKDEAFKVRLFRFVDLLPSVSQDRQTTALLEEYFSDLSTLPPTMRWGLRALSVTALGARMAGYLLRRQIFEMAKMFIAGRTPEDAEPTLRTLWKHGRACSVDLLGEASVSEAEAESYLERCRNALIFFGKQAAMWPAAPLLEHDHLGPLPRVNLSIKLSALYSQLDPIDPDGAYRALAPRLRSIFDLAKDIPATVTFDMEQAETKDVFLATFMRLLSEQRYQSYPHAGIALQAYLTDSASDLDRLIDWTRLRGAPITIRLVKGAYWDSETIRAQQRGWPIPVYQSKSDTDANYERMTRTLFQHIDVVRPAFGTHNLRSLAHAEAVAQLAGIPSDAYEFQMLYGMAEPLHTAVADAGRRIRVYTPVGELIPGMAYLVRRLLENTSNESFLRKEFTEKEPLDQLLHRPHFSEETQQQPDRRSAFPALAVVDDHFTNEPLTDFSDASARAAMQNAINRVKAQFGRRIVDALADGRMPAGPELIARDPSRPECILGSIGSCSVKDVEPAVASSVSAFGHWSVVPARERVAILRAAAKQMRHRRCELAAWEIFETGKPWREADADVAEAIDFLEFYAKEMQRYSRPRRLGYEPGELNELIYAPRGVAAVIAPWNFPLAIPTGMVAAALVTGNTVLFKPSERSSIVGHLLVELLHQAGVPKDVLQILPGAGEIGEALATHPHVDIVAFTGSKEVGLHLLAKSTHVTSGQRTMKKVIAEMGGKNAIVIDETADLDEAIVGVMKSFTGYQGQKCSACSRAIVHQSIYDRFLHRLTDAVMSLPIGPPEDPANAMGPMIDERAKKKVEAYIEIGRQEGRLIVLRDTPGSGFFIGPAVVADILPHHRLAQEEIFGPVLAVMRANDCEDALRIANHSSYALTGGIYSRSPKNIQMARTNFDVGNLYINRPITGALVNRQPFGGHRLSGIGAKAGGEDYLAQFMISRVVSENTLRRGFAPSEWE